MQATPAPRSRKQPDLLSPREIDAIVTGPIHKANIYEVGFQFPGQTEFFAARCGVDNFAMLLTGGRLTVALVTTHIPLAAVAKNLRASEIVRVGLLLADFLARRAPARIAVAGLNPHAGESGALGREEIEIISTGDRRVESNLDPRASKAPPSSPVRSRPTRSFIVRSRENSMPSFACITIRV